MTLDNGRAGVGFDRVGRGGSDRDESEIGRFHGGRPRCVDAHAGSEGQFVRDALDR